MDGRYTDEQGYKRAQFNIPKIGIVILVIGVIIGCAFIVIGFNNKAEIDRIYSDESWENIRSGLYTAKEELEHQMQPMQDQIQKLEQQRSELDVNDQSGRIYEIDAEIQALEDGIKPLQEQLSVVESEIFYSNNQNAQYQREIRYAEYVSPIMIGSAVVFISMLIGFSIIFASRYIEILMTRVQENMLLAQNRAVDPNPDPGHQEKKNMGEAAWDITLD